MKIGVLTSSRADFGIYIPLLNLLQNDSFFKLEIIAFGTHLSKNHGYTITEISNYGFNKIHKLETLLDSNSPEELAYSIGNTCSKFSSFWSNNKFDLIITLGDRYEMFAAVSAASPFNIKIAHIHAGETTTGAIDNAYRHAISLFSDYLFVSTSVYKKRANEIVRQSAKVFNVGALSIDNLKNVKLYNIDEFLIKFNIDLSIPTVLSTFHPETVSFEKNEVYIKELLDSFLEIKKKYQIIITMPNTDTMGQLIRDEILKFQNTNPEIIIIESFGMIGYLSCMKHCSFLLGNTSSGFVEASYFPKNVINLGERQHGRIESSNIHTVEINKKRILDTIKQLEKTVKLENENLYGNGDTAKKIISVLKKI